MVWGRYLLLGASTLGEGDVEESPVILCAAACQAKGRTKEVITVNTSHVNNTE